MTEFRLDDCQYALHDRVDVLLFPLRRVGADRFLNYVAIEIAFGLNRDWDAGLRIYHRSGAWGTYSNTADVGSVVGIALRRRF